MGAPGIDYPENKTPVDVQLETRSDILLSWAVEADDAGLLIAAPQDRDGRRIRYDNGEHVLLVWKGPEELRALPTELVETLLGDEPRWRLKPVGPATRGQRRDSVRVPIVLTIEVGAEGAVLPGTTMDISEGGIHCILERGAPAAAEGSAGTTVRRFEVGQIVDVTLRLDDDEDPVRNKAEVIRTHQRTDDHLEISVRFIGLPEVVGDRVRRRVFAEMRELRVRGVL